MNKYKDLKKYFIYEDKLRTNVSIVTGFFILMFNLFSGFMLTYIFANIVLNIKDPGNIIVILYFIPSIAVGVCLLKIYIIVFDFTFKKAELESYTYLRMLLLVSIVIYFFILIILILLLIPLAIKNIITFFI